jgi:hypothetical protein
MDGGERTAPALTLEYDIPLQRPFERLSTAGEEENANALFDLVPEQNGIV